MKNIITLNDHTTVRLRSVHQ